MPPVHTLPDITPALPELFLVCASLALLMLGVFRGDRSAREVSWLAVAALIVTLVIAWSHGGGREVTFSDMFVTDGFAVFMKTLVLIGSAVAIIMAMGYNEREGIARPEFPVLIMLSTAGMMMMISAHNLIALYLGLELQSLALYVLAAFRRDSAQSTEAGLKYFVLGALSSGMMLYGCSMVYGFAGTASFATLAQTLQGTASIGLLVGIVFVSVGIAFKVSAVPFHMWTPDVYEGAPTPVTAFFAVAPKIAAISLFIRVMVEAFGGLAHEWQQIIQFISAASMILGAFAAINQQNIKRLMAYSSIGHIGYALIGLAAANENGVRGILIYMAIYLFMNVGTFAVILCMRRDGKMVERIDELAGLSRTQPGTALAMAIFMFSMAGIPPLAGFFSKLYVFLAAINAGLVTLAVIGVLTSVVGAFYYLRIVKLMYFDEPAGTFDRPVGIEMKAVLVVTAVAMLFLGILPTYVVSGAETAAAALFAG
jgi:NADH-quinone oxidoreductase subunit N